MSNNTNFVMEDYCSDDEETELNDRIRMIKRTTIMILPAVAML
jgi:hypothetical protein